MPPEVFTFKRKLNMFTQKKDKHRREREMDGELQPSTHNGKRIHHPTNQKKALLWPRNLLKFLTRRCKIKIYFTLPVQSNNLLIFKIFQKSRFKSYVDFKSLVLFDSYSGIS